MKITMCVGALMCFASMAFGQAGVSKSLSQATADARYVNESGDAMTGVLTLDFSKAYVHFKSGGTSRYVGFDATGGLFGILGARDLSLPFVYIMASQAGITHPDGNSMTIYSNRLELVANDIHLVPVSGNDIEINSVGNGLLFDVARVVVPDATQDNEALNRQTGDARYSLASHAWQRLELTIPHSVFHAASTTKSVDLITWSTGALLTGVSCEGACGGIGTRKFIPERVEWKIVESFGGSGIAGYTMRLNNTGSGSSSNEYEGSAGCSEHSLTMSPNEDYPIDIWDRAREFHVSGCAQTIYRSSGFSATAQSVGANLDQSTSGVLKLLITYQTTP